MAGRRASRRRDPFRAYLAELTWRSYARDYFVSGGWRSAVGVVVGIVIFFYGVGRLFMHPATQTAGIVLVGLATAVFCGVAPLLGGWLAARVGRGDSWVERWRS